MRIKLLISAFCSALFLTIIGFSGCETFTQGRRLYEVHCQSCHMEDGTGLEALIPPLAGADYLESSRELVPCVIYQGAEGGMIVNGVKYTEPMPAFPALNEVEISNIINYINTSWGNNLPLTSPSEVKTALANCTPE